MRNFVKIVSILFQDNFHSGIQKSEMKSYNSISRQFSRCVEKRIIKKKEIERCVRILEIQGNSWNEANENKRKIGVYSRHARVYTLKAFCKPIPNRKLQVKRDAKGWGGGRFSTWWPTWCKNLWLHVSDNRESGRGNARIIGSPDNRCSNSRCLDNWRFTLTK